MEGSFSWPTRSTIWLHRVCVCVCVCMCVCVSLSVYYCTILKLCSLFFSLTRTLSLTSTFTLTLVSSLSFTTTLHYNSTTTNLPHVPSPSCLLTCHCAPLWRHRNLAPRLLSSFHFPQQDHCARPKAKAAFAASPLLEQPPIVPARPSSHRSISHIQSQIPILEPFPSLPFPRPRPRPHTTPHHTAPASCT